MIQFLRRWLAPALLVTVGLGGFASGLHAQQEGIAQGTIKKVDPAKGIVTITTGDKDRDFVVVEGTRIADAGGHPVEDRLKAGAFKEGTRVLFKAGKDNDPTVLVGLKLSGGSNAADAVRQAPPRIDMSAVKPLTDLAAGEKYRGFEGGLYPGGRNRRPDDHEAAGLALAGQIQPLGPDGRPDPDGKIVLLSVGMSNTNQAFAGFIRVARRDREINPKVVLVNGAQGGMTAKLIQDPDGGRTLPDGRRARYWDEVDEILKRAGTTRAQVQAVWIKQADGGPSEGFPAYAQALQEELAKIARILHERFPNLKLAYLSGRTYGGWAKTRLNPEPYAYESGFSVKWLIEQQLKGDPALNYDPERGPAEAPWLSWGPYLWANGATPRADGFRYEERDFSPDDGTHESPQGQEKIGHQLLQFFKSDSTTRPWFLQDNEPSARAN